MWPHVGMARRALVWGRVLRVSFEAKAFSPTREIWEGTAITRNPNQFGRGRVSCIVTNIIADTPLYMHVDLVYNMFVYTYWYWNNLIIYLNLSLSHSRSLYVYKYIIIITIIILIRINAPQWCAWQLLKNIKIIILITCLKRNVHRL